MVSALELTNLRPKQRVVVFLSFLAGLLSVVIMGLWHPHHRDETVHTTKLMRYNLLLTSPQRFTTHDSPHVASFKKKEGLREIDVKVLAPKLTSTWAAVAAKHESAKMYMGKFWRPDRQVFGNSTILLSSSTTHFHELLSNSHPCPSQLPMSPPPTPRPSSSDALT